MTSLLPRAEFEAWKSDHRTGATALTLRAAALLLAALQSSNAGPEDVQAMLRQLGGAHPGFGSLWQLLNRVARVTAAGAREGPSATDFRARIHESVEAFSRDLRLAEEALVRSAADLLPEGALIATYSRSSAVEGALRGASEKGRRFRVLLSEARPALEGETLARDLAEAGIPCVLCSDGALPMLLSRARLILLGADAITPKQFLNKAGTYSMLLAARENNVPAYALAVRAKFLAPLPGTLALPLHPPSELCANPGRDMEIVNAPLEEVPLGLLQAVVTESSALAPQEAGAAAAMAPLHPSLGADGAARGREPGPTPPA